METMRSLKESLEALRKKTLVLGSEAQPVSYTVPEYNCPNCHNVGWVYPRTADTEYTGGNFNVHAVPCSCRKMALQERRYRAMMKFCALPENADVLTFDKFTVKPGIEEAYNAVMEFMAGEVIFLTMIGNVNLGKTHLAVATAREYINQNIPAKYAFVPELLDNLQASYDRDASNDFMTVFHRYSNVPLLIMDDLYRQKPTAWRSEKLMSLINARYMARLQTIFTTNKSFDEICQIDKEQGEAITSRLQREKWCRVVVIK